MSSIVRSQTRRLSAGLWLHRDFLKFWAGETISMFGTQVTALALPLTAVLMLQATPGQMGILGAAQFAPFLLITLLAGVWIDRRRRRPILIGASLGRAILVGLIPLFALLSVLRMEHLYGIAFLVGILTVFFDVGYLSYVPTLVSRDQLIEANSKLQVSASAAEIGGPGFAGVLVELVTAPFALVADALSYLASAIGLILIHRPEPAPPPITASRSLWREIGEGLQVTFGNKYLRPIAGEAATYNMFNQVMLTVFVLYATRDLGLTPGILGFIFTTGSIGSLIGALWAERIARRLGIGPTIIGAMVLGCSAPLLIPLASGSTAVVISLLTLAYFLGGIGVTISNVHVVSLRQTVTPDRLLGRMTASYRLVVYGAIPVGALIGGGLGEAIGLRATLAVGAIGLLFAVSWVLFSPVSKLRELPAEAGD